MTGGTGEQPWRLMTIRISHDSGRTYGPPLDVRSDDYLPPVSSSEWPPCQCPKHRAAKADGRQLPDMRTLRADGS